jgi:hypothetical protein
LSDWLFEAAAIIVSGNHLRAHGCIGWPKGNNFNSGGGGGKGQEMRGRWRKKKLQQGVEHGVDRTDNQ